MAGHATLKSGGVDATHANLDITYTLADCTADCTGLQAIQVVWVAETASQPTLGKMSPVTVGKTKYDAFVDGGKNSPYVLSQGNTPAHASKPYYLTADEVKNGVVGCDINLTDGPAAVYVFDEVYFETAIVCIDSSGSGHDRIVRVFKWGWADKGKTYKTSPGSGGKGDKIEEYDAVSDAFKDVVKFDYPGYLFD